MYWRFALSLDGSQCRPNCLSNLGVFVLLLSLSLFFDLIVDFLYTQVSKIILGWILLLDCLIVGYHCYLPHVLSCWFSTKVQIHNKWHPSRGNKTNYSNEHHGYQKGYREIFQKQRLWVVESEDATNLNSINVCKSFEGWGWMLVTLSQSKKIEMIDKTKSVVFLQFRDKVLREAVKYTTAATTWTNWNCCIWPNHWLIRYV